MESGTNKSLVVEGQLENVPEMPESETQLATTIILMDSGDTPEGMWALQVRLEVK